MRFLHNKLSATYYQIQLKEKKYGTCSTVHVVMNNIFLLILV